MRRRHKNTKQDRARKTLFLNSEDATAVPSQTKHENLLTKNSDKFPPLFYDNSGSEIELTSPSVVSQYTMGFTNAYAAEHHVAKAPTWSLIPFADRSSPLSQQTALEPDLSSLSMLCSLCLATYAGGGKRGWWLGLRDHVPPRFSQKMFCGWIGICYLFGIDL